MRKDSLAARETLTKFFESEIEKTKHSAGQWISTLPMRDGDLDLEAMGLSLEEFLELSKEKYHFPNWDQFLTQFLIEVKALPDRQKEPQ